MKKEKKSGKRLIIPSVGILVSIMSFSIGFSAWNVVGGQNALVSGLFEAENAEYDYKPVYLLEVTTSPTYTFLAGRGFLNASNEFVSSITLNWSLKFNGLNANNYITSMLSNKAWFSISISISNTPSLISGFSVSSMTLSGASGIAGTPTVYQQTYNNNLVDVVNDGATINQQWNVDGVSNSLSTISYSLSVPLTYTGSISSFPDLSTNKIKITLLPGEYKNA